RVIAKKTLRDFWELYPETEQALKSWHHEVSKAHWKNMNELKSQFPSASLLIHQKVCFNIKGNHYRLIVKINFEFQTVWIRFIGTHKEYDIIDIKTI
ncbi:MAG: type II toxin-antitoxin system HigB family toxin, partial [Flavobacterium sp.]